MNPTTVLPRWVPASAPSTSSLSTPANVHALIIGINSYPFCHNLRQLRRAVYDAEAFQCYLTQDLRVSRKNITTLLENQATRRNILSALQSFETNSSIEWGDPIVIYYAGHGGEAPAPPSWNAEGNKIQLLLPHDVTNGNARHAPPVYGIPDTTIAVILNRLARRKGNNITVILDCCHSASGTRAGATQETEQEQDPEDWIQYRGSDVEMTVPEDIDRDIWNADVPVDIPDVRAMQASKEFQHTALYSHTLLAACKSDQSAREIPKGGVFTEVLLSALRTTRLDKTTYADLIKRLPAIIGQYPQCEGYNKDRMLFNAKVRHNVPVYDVVPIPNGGGFEIAGGEVQGIARGAAFAVFANPQDARAGQRCLGIVVARKLSALATLVDTPQSLLPYARSGPLVAVQISAGAESPFQIFCSGRTYNSLEKILSQIQSILVGEGKRTFGLTNDPRSATMAVELSTEMNNVTFPILDHTISQFGMHHIPYRVSPNLELIRPILESAARFDWHLHRESKMINQNHFDVELTQVVKKLEQSRDLANGHLFLRVPEGSNLIEKIDHRNIVFFDVKAKKMYGLKITNKTDRPFWVTMLYFDHSNLSIGPFFEPPTSSSHLTSEAPLKPRSSLTVGYGSGGGRPLEFVMEQPEAKVEMGTIKLYFSTAPADLSPIRQLTPFNEEGRRGGRTVTIPLQPAWGTMAIQAVLRAA